MIIIVLNISFAVTQLSNITTSSIHLHIIVQTRATNVILPLSAATPPAPAFSLAESRGISEMLSTRPESRLSVFKYSVLSKYQIQKKEVRQPLSHPCSHVVFQEIFVTEATQGLSQKSKTAWINNQAHT